MSGFTLAGATIAAQSLGHPQSAELIWAEAMTPQRIVSLFRQGASKNARRDAALVLLAGSVARYHSDPEGWSGEPEATLAHGLVGKSFGLVSSRATRIVELNWSRIEEMVRG